MDKIKVDFVHHIRKLKFFSDYSIKPPAYQDTKKQKNPLEHHSKTSL